MNKQPKISVVIPVFNGADYLEQAVGSILRQTYKNYEIIVVNDGSNDNGRTRETAKSFGSRIRYFEKENGGVSSALNMGISKMTGEYFAWLSHDDLFCETKFEDQISAVMESGKEDTIVQGNYFLCNEDFTKSVETSFEKYYPVAQLCSSVFLLLWGEIHFSSLLFHKKHFKRVGVFDEALRYAQDNDFIFRLCRNQESVFVQEPVSMVRLHHESGTNCFHDDVDKENRELYLKIAESLTSEEINAISNSATKLYAKLGGIIHSMGGSVDAVNRKLSFCEHLFSQDEPEIKKMKEKKLVIFGAGQYGRRLKYELEVRGINISCFVDNAEEKDGQMIDGVLCHKVSYLKQHPEANVIIAQKFYEAAEEQISTMRVQKVLRKDDVDSVLLKY